MKYDQVEGIAQALFEETGDALFFFDPETDEILDANGMAQRLTGFAVRDLHRMKVTDLLHSTESEGIDHLHRAAKKTTIFHSQEGYFLQTVQRKVRIPVNITIARLHVKPQTLGMITARDVRKQHEARVRLQAMEAELRRVLDSVSDCLWSGEVGVSGKWMYHYISPVAERITGQTAEFFLAGIHRWWSIVHPDDQPRWTKALARQRAGQATEEEYRILWPDGTVRWVRENVRASRDGKSMGAVRLDGVVTDITAQREASRTLRTSEERFQAFLSHGPFLAYIKDADGRYVYSNAVFETLVPPDRLPIVGKTDAELFSPEIASTLRQHDADALSANETRQTIEPGLGLDRSWRVFRFPFHDHSGKKYVGGIGMDLANMADVRTPPQATA